MDIVKIISITLSSLMVIILLRRLNGEYALIASCIINISICVFSLGILFPVFEFLKDMGESNLENLYSIIFKSAGICILCSFASEICKDCNEASLGSKIEFAGKCTLLSMSLPLIQKVFQNATKFIE